MIFKKYEGNQFWKLKGVLLKKNILCTCIYNWKFLDKFFLQKKICPLPGNTQNHEYAISMIVYNVFVHTKY